LFNGYLTGIEGEKMTKSTSQATAQNTTTPGWPGTMVELTEKSYQLLHTFLQKQYQNPTVNMDHLSHLGSIYQELWQKMASDPMKIAQAQFSYWQDFLNLWQNSVADWMGQPNLIEDHEQHKDKRFKDEAWQHPLFDTLKRFYLLTAKHIQKVVNNVEGLDEKTAHQVDFYTRQFIDAMSPTNFWATNPEVLRAIIESKGENFLRGLDNMLHDLERSEDYFHIKMTDHDAFKVGKNIATTPGKVIFQNELIQLIQYEPTTKQVYSKPLLIIPPWINKYYILDLSEKNSYVKWIVDQGFTVFLISWVNPDHRHTKLDFQDYMQLGPLSAIEAIQQAWGCEQVNALGFCIGGTLLASTLAYLAAVKKTPISSATYLATLLDFSKPGDMGVFIDEKQISQLEQNMQKKGYLDGGAMSTTFNLLRANDLIWSYFIKNYLLGEEPFPFDMLYWNSDTTNMPAKMHSTYLRKMYLHNQLAKPNAMTLLKQKIDLRNIQVPACFVSTHNDHIAPWDSTYIGAKLHSGPVKFMLGGSGHIAGIVNPPSKNKYHTYVNDQLPDSADQWIEGSTLHEGSWWPLWAEWLAQQSGKKIPARAPQDSKLKPIEAAPGSYVSKRLDEID
jgi:polyhydroxyalkanoate synthase